MTIEEWLNTRRKEDNIDHTYYGRLSHFIRRYTDNELGYGKGHFLFALYASVPVLLTPDLLHTLWFNFKTYQVENETFQTIHPVAVTDLLMSGICREVKRNTYELLLPIRLFLNNLLQELEQYPPSELAELVLDKKTTQKLAEFCMYYANQHPQYQYTQDWACKEAQILNAKLILQPAKTLIEIANELSRADNKAKLMKQLSLIIDPALSFIENRGNVHNKSGNYANYGSQLQLLLTYTKSWKKLLIEGKTEEALLGFEALLKNNPPSEKQTKTPVFLPIPQEVSDKLFPDSPFQIALQRIRQAKQTQATTLDLSKLNLTKIPQEIEELTQLEVLHLYYNQINSLESISKLTKLRELLLHDNQIQSLEPLSKLVQLQKLYLGNNQIADVRPLQLLQLLETLYLHHNQIQDISPLASLDRLQTLFLQHNQIANIQPLLPFLTRTPPLKVTQTSETGVINTANNPLTNPPPNIAVKGNQAILKYFDLSDCIKQIPQNMRPIQGGTFEMGDVFDDNYYKGEKPIHKVTVADFYMSAHCVTFEEYDAFCAATGRDKPNDSGWGRGKLPVINISWYNATAYCNWLSEQLGLEPVYTINGEIVTSNWDVNGYRLPTEAEWEYAAREGGKRVRFGNGQNTLRPTEANFYASKRFKQPYSEVGEYRGKTLAVDSFKPNALGLYNMSGNVWEWCWDWFGNDYYKNSPQENPKGPASGSSHVIRGGGWYHFPQNCRVSYRDSSAPDNRHNSLGFRLAFVPQFGG